ncbi:MAG TPA: SDR family oxidoreductase [Mycobacteriales bacterium]|nr:SDR family oxidoreductase [Mycobacteriales bacterium]
MDLGLHDRVYLATGASRGLGFATAAALVADGARVVVAARNPDSVNDAVKRLGDRARGLALDLADPDAASRLVDLALGEFGRLDGALLSVGGPPATSALGATDEQWLAAFESVFLGAVRAVRALVPRLEAGAAIAIVLSTSVKAPIGGLAISNGLRPGLAMWAKCLADEVGPRGIRVVGLMPGSVLTDRIRELTPDRDAQERAASTIPLRRLGEPMEFGKVAAFALSPAASYLTGCVIPVDGGTLRAL